MNASERIATEAATWVARRDAGFTGEDEVAFRRWRASDPRHENALKTYQDAWGLLGTPAAQGKGGEMGRLLARSARQRRRRRAFVAAGTVAVFISTFAILRNQAPLPAAVVVTPERLELSDGSIVELKNGARLTERYSAAIRELRLDAGEAHFEVKPDSTRPFVVTSGGVAVRAVGTAFAVQLDGGGSVEVVVSHGVVAVQPPTVSKGESNGPLTLERGDLVRLEPAMSAQPASVRTLDAAGLAERLGWRMPRIEFSKASLGEAVELFNRHRGPDMPKLVVTDPEVRALPVSGVFRADNADAFVALLESAFGLKVQRAVGVVSIGSSASP